MHNNSLKLMSEFVEKYKLKDEIVIDIGSRDINGSYRPLFSDGYIGADIVPGKNVDVIIGSAVWKIMNPVNAIISGQTLEHVANPALFMETVDEKLMSKGIICLIAPSGGPIHENPWVQNISEELMTQIVSDAGFRIVECKISNVKPWMDCICIARKK